MIRFAILPISDGALRTPLGAIACYYNEINDSQPAMYREPYKQDTHDTAVYILDLRSLIEYQQTQFINYYQTSHQPQRLLCATHNTIWVIKY